MSAWSKAAFASTLIGAGLPALAASPVPPAHAPAKAAEPVAQRQASPSGEADPASRNVVARARMLECGHQWSNMKKAGTASGTWKDFSRGCLAQR